MSIGEIDGSLLLAIAGFAFVTSATPGPNNVMLLASGANYGFRRSLPHMTGIVVGVALLLALTLAGLGELFRMYPASHQWLQVAGISYLLWLAWRIATTPVSNDPENGSIRAHSGRGPMRWWQATAFQFLNPKAWMMALAAVSGFTLTGDLYLTSGLVLMAVFALVGFPSIALWAVFGTLMQALLHNPSRQRAFNWTMAALTAATALLIIGSQPV